MPMKSELESYGMAILYKAQYSVPEMLEMIYWVVFVYNNMEDDKGDKNITWFNFFTAFQLKLWIIK